MRTRHKVLAKIAEEDVRYFLSNMTNCKKQFTRLAVPHNINNIIFEAP
jgi:hypothetical protein